MNIYELIEDFDNGKRRLYIPYDETDEVLESVGIWFDDLSKREPYSGTDFVTFFQRLRYSSPHTGTYAFVNLETRGVYDGAEGGYFKDNGYPDRAKIKPMLIDEFLECVKNSQNVTHPLDSEFDNVWR